MTESRSAVPVFDADERILVGIPVLNRSDLLECAIASIDQPARILIINNNNVDREFNDHVHELAVSDSRLHIVDQPRNLGVAASWNLILQTAFAAGYEWAFIASNDVVLAPSSLTATIRCLQQGDSGVCHLCAWNCFAVSRTTVERVGWFDENFYPAYKEDQDYSYRCELAGVLRSNVDGASGTHHGSATIRSDAEYERHNAVTHIQYNHHYYVSKWGGDACAETYRHPFNNDQYDVRWWPSPRDSIRDRDWDRERPPIRDRIPPLTTSRIYDRARANPSDISEHLSILHKYGSTVQHITEFCTRVGNSTAAFLLAAPDRLISYDSVRQPEVDELESAARHEGIQFRFMQQPPSRLREIETTDLLFLDSVHTFERVEFELRFAEFVRRYIILHDTETFGLTGEDGGEGIWRAVSEFLKSHADWRLQAHFPNNNGLTILERASDFSN